MNPDVTLEDIAGFFATMKKIGAANPEGTAELEEAGNKAFQVPSPTYAPVRLLSVVVVISIP